MPSTVIGSGLPLPVELLIVWVFAFVIGWFLNLYTRRDAGRDMKQQARLLNRHKAAEASRHTKTALEAHLAAENGSDLKDATA